MLVRTLKILATLFFLSSVGLYAQDPSSTVDSKEVASIDLVLGQVKSALTEVQKDLKGKRLPQLKSVTLTLNTVAQKDVGGSIKLWVITLGGKHETDKTQEVVLTLVPPSPDNPIQVASESLSAALKGAIESAALGAQNASQGEYPLKFSGLNATIAFAVKNTGNGGANLQILPVSLSLTGDIAKNQTQTLKVVFDDTPNK